jgi:hypothetical protein
MFGSSSSCALTRKPPARCRLRAARQARSDRGACLKPRTQALALLPRGCGRAQAEVMSSDSQAAMCERCGGASAEGWSSGQTPRQHHATRKALRKDAASTAARAGVSVERWIRHAVSEQSGREARGGATAAAAPQSQQGGVRAASRCARPRTAVWLCFGWSSSVHRGAAALRTETNEFPNCRCVKSRVSPSPLLLLSQTRAAWLSHHPRCRERSPSRCPRQRTRKCCSLRKRRGATQSCAAASVREVAAE